MQPANYDKIAWCYDLLCHIIFGNAIRKAQTDMLNFIPANAHILIAGGGTGWILEELAKTYRSGLSITYIDASGKMIDKSKRRETGLNSIKFICMPVEHVKTGNNNYDVVITPFFFDNFSQANSRLIFEQLHASLRKKGLWFFTDFKLENKEAYWQKPMLNLMYFFFKTACGLKEGKLPDSKELFVTGYYKKIEEKAYYGNFIFSSLFEKL